MDGHIAFRIAVFAYCAGVLTTVFCINVKDGDWPRAALFASFAVVQFYLAVMTWRGLRS